MSACLACEYSETLLIPAWAGRAEDAVTPPVVSGCMLLLGGSCHIFVTTGSHESELPSCFLPFAFPFPFLRHSPFQVAFHQPFPVIFHPLYVLQIFFRIFESFAFVFSRSDECLPMSMGSCGFGLSLVASSRFVESTFWICVFQK